MPNIVQPNPLTRIVDENGVMTQEFRDWVQDMTNTDLFTGTGSPEGVIKANIGRTYQDNSGIAGTMRYAKKLSDIGGDESLGWILI